MNTFCPEPQNNCPDPSAPVVNYSSEAIDRIAFFGRQYNPGLQPPLGSPWKSTGCIGTCTSEISQADADACAARQVITCLSNEWPVYEDNPSTDPDQPPVITRERQTFDNDPQSCDFTCPDGSVFTYTIPAGTVRAFSQAAADASAQSMACNGAIDNRICIGELVPSKTCEGEEYSGTVSISMPEANFPIVVSIVAGALPVNSTLDYDPDDGSFTITGQPGVAGQYGFTVRVEDIDGNAMEKAFLLDVIKISPDTLAEGTEGNVYSETLTTVGAVTGDVTWAVESGSLPPGLSLNPTTGEISGTPTTDGDFTFTVSMTDESL